MRTLAVVLVLALIWLAGLVAFADRARKAEPPAAVPNADGVVALTGASDERIGAALNLLEQGRARRLLVSGVNTEVRREELRQVAGAPRRLYECCVDLGYDAQDTLGNAQEIADWARDKRFRTLIVVTSDYHMPRSLLEIRAAMPEAQLFPYPVATQLLDNRKWWQDQRTTRLITVEYCKYLAVLARDLFIRLGDAIEGEKAEPSEAAAEAAPAKAG